jgi:hypothetical protein
MKYIKKFEEQQLSLFDDYSDEIEIIFEDKEWRIIKPKSYEAFDFYTQNIDWNFRQYDFNNDIYLNINKEDNNIIVFDFYNEEFYDKEANSIYLEDFFNKNSNLMSIYGKLYNYSNIVEENNSYWYLVDDWSDFTDFFNTDRRDITEGFIKSVLAQDAWDMFQYDNDVFQLDDYGLELKDDSLFLLKIMLIIKKTKDDDFDFDLDDIKDYSDVCSVIEEYGIKDIEDFLKMVISRSHEYSDQDNAFEELTEAIIDFFNFEKAGENDSPKWQHYNNSKHQKLWVKFKTNDDAYRISLILNFPDQFEDKSYIDYSPPYYGYSGDYKVTNTYFNDEVYERYIDYNFNDMTYEEIDEASEIWKDIKKKHPDYSDEKLFNDVYLLLLDTNKYNL